MNSDEEAALVAVLKRSQRYGFLGPDDPSAHIRHAGGLVDWLNELFGDSEFFGADLGSGGGVPGLIEALSFPKSRWTFIETMQKRADFLQGVVQDLYLEERVTVLRERAELVGRNELYRGQFNVVSSRSFGLPAITAECAAPLLGVGGSLLVSEPPITDPTRWPLDGLSQLGMVSRKVQGGWMRIEQETTCPERYPRRVGVPAKRPLWIE